jgi:type II secretory pathway pseudopilin PulG
MPYLSIDFDTLKKIETYIYESDDFGGQDNLCFNTSVVYFRYNFVKLIILRFFLKQLAFTIIELVFVIIVLGILASLAMGRMDRDLRQEASETILSHIRLTQQLALDDNKHLPNFSANWQRAYWRIQFKNCSTTGEVKPIYNVGSDLDLSGGSDISKGESAIDPINGKYLYATCFSSSLASDVSRDILIGQKFGVTNLKLNGCSSIAGSTANQIAFDYLGRPHRGIAGYDAFSSFDRIIRTDCNLTITLSDSTTFSIIIEKETGHAYIEGQENL